MQAGVGLLDTDVMPVFMIIALDVIIIMRFSIHCSAVICSPTVIFVISKKPLVKPMAPRSLFLIIESVYILLVFDLLFCNLYFPIYKPKIPKIFTLLSLSDLTFAREGEGIANPFIALVASS